MTNRSINLLMKMMLKDNGQKVEIAKQILEIEYKKILAQARNFSKLCGEDELVNAIFELENVDELFDYLNILSVVEISILSSYGIDVAFMNLLKVSD